MPRIVPVLVLAIATTLAGCKPTTPVPPGDVAAKLTVPTAAGAPFDPATLKGQPALVVFWRPTCPHCLAELPEAVRAAKDKGVTAVAVQVTGTPESGQAVLTKIGWTGPALIDDGRLRTALDIKAVPYTLVLRPDGTAKKAWLGRQSYDTLAGAL